MIIAKNDEAKRSKIWRIVTLVSSVLIIVIAIFLLTKLFTANPLEGTWVDRKGQTLEVKPSFWQGCDIYEENYVKPL